MTSSVAVDMERYDGASARWLNARLPALGYKASGAQLIMGNGHFVAQETLEVSVHGAGTRTFTADKIIFNVGTHAVIPSVPGLVEAMPARSAGLLTSRRLSSIIEMGRVLLILHIVIQKEPT
jgi:pyruvate/2-oxoglutarate dehydrogenase complex dihydrolipoamide dehydrogenase (E3) component